MDSTSATRRWSGGPCSAPSTNGGRRSSRPSTRTRSRFFKPDVPPFRLTTLDQRERLFAHAGADAMLVFDFDEELRATSAEDFVTRLLARQIGAAGVVTGDDFSFGKGRAGNVEVLQHARRLARHRHRGGGAGDASTASRVSSGRIREALDRRRHRPRDAPAQPRLSRSRASSSAATSAGGSSAIRPRTCSSAIISARSTASTPCA